MNIQYETLKLEIDSRRVGIITLNRPDVLNAMNTCMMTEVRDCFLEFHANDDAVCLVLTGAGTRGFCAGADLKERNGMSESVWRRQHLIDTGQMPGITSGDQAGLVAARRRIAELETELAIHRQATQLLGKVVPPKGGSRPSR